MIRLFLLSVCVLTASATAEERVSFSRQIRGILSDRCFQCHGPDEAERQAGLRLDQKESAFAELDSGQRAIVPGDPESSEILRRLTADDPDLRMPPADFGRSVSQAEIELIRTWILQGASWGQHWAFEPVVRPELPESAAESDHPIDAFVAARLQREGLSMSPEADRITLLRRVSLDLTGLPPTPEEVDDFLADTSPDAWERVVDRLLDSPRHGEHMARYWLDIARYGDTHGLHLDNFREMWAYRDWVIRAFSSNMPWDVFITEQLAGDLLPNPTDDQLIASGFNRCNVTTNEGGSIAEEVHVRNVVDRTVTAGTAFMALTLDCSRCHDHKFDPISMKDFYALYAFFNSFDGNPMDGNQKDHPPTIRVFTDEQKSRLADLQQRRAHVESQISARLADIVWKEPDTPDPRRLEEPEDVVWIEDALPEGGRVSGKEWTFVKKPQPVYSGNLSIELTADGLEQNVVTDIPVPLVIAEDDSLFCYVWLDPDSPPREIMLQFHAADWNHRVYWGANRIDWGQDGTPSRHHAGPLPATGRWVRLEVAAADVGLTPGTAVNGWACTQFDGRALWDHAGLRTRTVQSPWYDSFQVWLNDMKRRGGGGLPEDIAEAVVRSERPDSAAEPDRRLLRYFLRHAWIGMKDVLAPLRQELADITAAIDTIHKQAGTTLIYRETAEPKPAWILVRGEYDKRGEPVSRDVPGILPPFPADAPRNRLGLARWLTLPEHPLTARVAVNRFWQQFFGIGLVRTSEDFGSQGEPPSHPQLLDWLSAEFQDPQLPGARHRWDVRHIIRQIVLSRTYRQSAVVRPELRDRDPENRLLARGPRFRLDAETLRDQALFVSGLLYEKTGGPGVKPPQPPGLWNAVGYTDSNTANFTPDTGHERVHRRSIYTFIKRTSPPPQMSTFDAPSRESCVVRRERSNSPMQALLLMNDPQYVECARGLAERCLREAGPGEQDRVRFAFRQCLLRFPSEEEIRGLIQDYHDFLAEFRADPEAARQLIHVGEDPPADDADPAQLAAWTMVCNLLMNLDEFLCK